MQLLVIGGSGRVGTMVLPRAGDVARAILAAVEHRNGVDAITISGDAAGRSTSLRKAGDVLHWAPTRPASADR